MSDNTTIIEAELIINDTNALTIPDPIKTALVESLRPVADRMALYAQKAGEITVTNDAQKAEAEEVCNAIQADIKSVEKQEVLSKIVDGLHKLHGRWCGLRKSFVEPMTASRKTIRDKVIQYTVAEQEKAEAEQRRLQALADEKARRETEALLKKAADAKKTETQTRYKEQAAAVVAPTITVAAPKTTMRGVAKVWKIRSLDAQKFFAALAVDRTLQGFVTIEQTKMERAKSNNPATEIAGVVFEQKIR